MRDPCDFTSPITHRDADNDKSTLSAGRGTSDRSRNGVGFGNYTRVASRPREPNSMQRTTRKKSLRKKKAGASKSGRGPSKKEKRNPLLLLVQFISVWESSQGGKRASRRMRFAFRKTRWQKKGRVKRGVLGGGCSWVCSAPISSLGGGGGYVGVVVGGERRRWGRLSLCGVGGVGGGGGGGVRGGFGGWGGALCGVVLLGGGGYWGVFVCCVSFPSVGVVGVRKWRGVGLPLCALVPFGECGGEEGGNFGFVAVGRGWCVPCLFSSVCGTWCEGLVPWRGVVGVSVLSLSCVWRREGRG